MRIIIPYNNIIIELERKPTMRLIKKHQEIIEIMNNMHEHFDMWHDEFILTPFLPSVFSCLDFWDDIICM